MFQICKFRSCLLYTSPSILIRIPILGNFSAKRIIRSSNHPEVEITTRGDLWNATFTISSRSSRIKGSPPVIFMNFTFGSFSISAGVISLFLSVGFCHILHIWHCIGQRYVTTVSYTHLDVYKRQLLHGPGS